MASQTTDISFSNDVLVSAMGATVTVSGEYYFSNYSRIQFTQGTYQATYISGDISVTNETGAVDTFDFNITYTSSPDGSSYMSTPTGDTYGSAHNGNGVEVYLNNLAASGSVSSTLDFTYDPPKPSVLNTAQYVSGGIVYSATEAPVFSVSNGPLCFRAGTMIRTPGGDVLVESLRPGDLVLTATGQPRQVLWMGHRVEDCTRHPWPADVLPVCVAAHAFGENRPARDLFLSPQHAIAVSCLNEVLIPIRHLANGATIQQAQADEVSYWHVELDSHDILLAENLPAESFLDTLGRAFFDNGASHAAAHPGLALKTMGDFCRPLIETGPVVTAVRAQLAARAEALGWTISRDAELHLLVDGQRVDPVVAGKTARFVVPAAACDVVLRTRSFVPKIFEHHSWDDRRLGVPVRSIALFDGLNLDREVAIDDPVLVSGFHAVEKDPAHWWRWTDGEAVLDASLWADARADFFLRVELTDIAYFRTWEPPRQTDTADAIDLAAYRAKVG